MQRDIRSTEYVKARVVTRCNVRQPHKFGLLGGTSDFGVGHRPHSRDLLTISSFALVAVWATFLICLNYIDLFNGRLIHVGSPMDRLQSS